jgi:hexosaminidase
LLSRYVEWVRQSEVEFRQLFADNDVISPAAVIGVEAPLWSETLRSLDNIEFMAFPRMAAIAELGRSPWSTHDWTSFRARLGSYGPRWEQQGVDFYHSPQIDWS